jgi:flagellar assembly protein FliH
VQSFQYLPVTSAAVRDSKERLAVDAVLLDLQQQSERGQSQTASVQAALEQGFREGEAHAKASLEPMLEEVRKAVLAAVDGFVEERGRYLQRVEGEAVRLALAVARRILHREAQIDPLLLSGLVRVALDRIQQGTRVTLRTSAANVELWRHYFQENWHGRQAVEVVADAELEGHVCWLQSEVGNVEISLEGQLQEIETGFFDLLAKLPGAGQ